MKELLIDVILLVRSGGLKWSGKWRCSLLSPSSFFPWVLLIWILVCFYNYCLCFLSFYELACLGIFYCKFLVVATNLHLVDTTSICALSFGHPFSSCGPVNVVSITFFDSIPHCYVHGLTFWNNKKTFQKW